MGMTNCSDGRTSSSRKSFNSITTESPQTKMAATAAHSHTASPTGKDQDPQEFLNGLMRDLGLDPNRPEAIDSEEVSAAIEAAEESPLENSRGSTIELTEETHSVELDHSPEKKAEPAPTQGWNQIVRKTRGVHHAKNQWRQRAGIKPLDKPLTGPDGEPLSPEEYSAHRLEMRKRELIGRTIEGELIPREKGKGYFIKWNRWRHDRVFMSAACVESVLGPRPKPGTMIRCTINRLGPDHVPWNCQNPVSNEVEHWYLRPSGYTVSHPSNSYPHQGLSAGSSFRQADGGLRPFKEFRPRSYSKQQWEYAGVCSNPNPLYQMPPGNGYNSPANLSRSGSVLGQQLLSQGSPVMAGKGISSAVDAFSERPKGRANRAGSWRSPSMTNISRQASDFSSMSPSTISRLATEGSISSMPAISLGSRFQRPVSRGGSLSELTRNSTAGTKSTSSNMSAGSPKK